MLKASDIKQKEVVNIDDGKRLGFVSDVEIDFERGVVEAVIVPGNPRAFGLFGRNEDYVIPWDQISKIGEDYILVRMGKTRYTVDICPIL